MSKMYAIWHSRTLHIQSIKRWKVTIAPIKIRHHASKCSVKTLDLEV